ncbi:ABC transporter ATP-binding protein [Comamonas endophytica]|uniref:ABC transporter ATP-binding protein n=2 Tax=Comamonas endophytica TaxID=2949090 RepID=A0ABY6GF24_9BURK|nr:MULTISPECIES: ABC transporter ATP-binding protein [unclassified Acidovorax]MCD2512517.1 ABC transporter ATP-binding protein [Acidovorax sp. D4N7]UYG53117.1 ABC transporter ATP-binding protein [Acidovorax sp. 5MLIR]
MLEIRDLDAGYGDTQVLFGMDMQVQRGEVVAIVGSNGVGKTTLLRTIAGLLQPMRGSIRFDGAEIGGQATKSIVEQGVVLVPEGRRLFPRMTVRRNLELGAYSKRARPHLEQRLDFVHRLFPILQERAQQLGGTLSGGQQQMCAIARGLVAMPELLMLDEVSLGLAPIAVDRVYDAIQSIRDSGVTLLIVEQNVSRALAMADRAYVLQHGHAALSGTGRELSQNPEVQSIYLGLNHKTETLA